MDAKLTDVREESVTENKHGADTQYQTVLGRIGRFDFLEITGLKCSRKPVQSQPRTFLKKSCMLFMYVILYSTLKIIIIFFWKPVVDRIG